VFKKGKGILLTLVSVHPIKHSEVYSKEIDEKIDEAIKKNSLKIDCKLKASIWGHFDIAFIMFSDNNKDLLKLYDLPPLPLTKDWRYYFGTCFYPQQLDIEEVINDLPLFGVSFIKFKKEMWASLNIDLEEFLEWLSKKVKEDILPKINVEEDKFRFAIITSYGWEDVIFLFFSNSYRKIKRAVLEIRAIKAETLKNAGILKKEIDEKDIGQHLIVTTCSILGVNFDFAILNEKEEIQQTFLNKIEDENIGWEIKFQTRPGHSDKLRHQLKGKNIIGRNDLAIFEENGSLREFFNAFFLSSDSIFRVISDKENPIVSSSETSLFFDFGDGDVETGEGGVKDSSWLEKYSQRQEKIPNISEEIKKLPLSIRDNSTLKNLLMAVDHLKREHDLINDTFIPLFEISDRFLDILSEPNLKISWQIIAYWLRNFELCFKDRFRGIYPVGETSTIPLVTYRGSFHKFLLIVDSIACWAFDKARCNVNSEFKDIIKSNTKADELPVHIMTSYIGNPRIPCVYSHSELGSGFIYAPIDLMFYPENLFYIFHETGHSFFRMCKFYNILNPKEISNEKIKRLFGEVVADYFAGTIGFGGDWDAFKILFDSYLYKISQPKPAEYELRLTLSKAVYNYIKNGNISQLTKENSEIKNILNNPELPEEVKVLPYYLIENLESETVQLKKFLSCLTNSPSNFDKEHENSLVMLRKFFKEVAATEPFLDSFSDQKRRCFFHSFWLKVYKKAISTYFDFHDHIGVKD